MSEHEIDTLVLRRFESAQTPWGRWKLNTCTGFKRNVWRWVLFSAFFIKRFSDIIVSSVALLALLPLFAVVAAVILLDDGGPVFFGQKRVGKRGREFKMWKFRSMRVDAERKLETILAQNEQNAGITFKVKKDPRITRVGKWLRKFSIDELPQFYNVLVGDMSLVGPRPPVPREVAKYTWADRRRLEVVPGLTCFWQIGGRSNIDFPEQVRLDVRYIESQSFWLDLKILLKTVPAVLLGRGAC
jgi:exopolysaccharide biosynthesis polyprenyl glycosylphosphotransferase